MSILYPVYKPLMNGNEKKYVMDCMDSTWISSKGKYIQLFENKFAEYIGVKGAASINNGTAALHVALLALGIQPGDEIIVPTFTYIASVNAIAYMGATPVFVDSLQNTWQVDPDDIKRKITGKTKAILAVHLYGHPCEMDTIAALCKQHKLFLVEDCAEAIGSLYKGRHVGVFGDISAFSFFGNKTVTTGEGGMVVSNNEKLLRNAAHIKNQGVTSVQYWHDIIGYNYRMTNICAAIGLAQMEQIDAFIKLKKDIAVTYKNIFENTSIEFQPQSQNVDNAFWMCSCLVKLPSQRGPLMEFLKQNGIDTRPLFYPAHTMPMYKNITKENFKIADSISSRGINLPSYPELSGQDVKFIANKVLEFTRTNG